jgi:threonine dehydrogenase-like Zn-dependent dehydrogenase
LPQSQVLTALLTPYESEIQLKKMKAPVFHRQKKIGDDEVPRPPAGVGAAVIRVTLITICGTYLHIVRGEYQVKPGLIIGHEPVGVIEELGAGVTGFQVGDRVLAVASIRWIRATGVLTFLAVVCRSE